MRKSKFRNFVKYILIAGGISTLILIAITFDIIQNQKEEFPWFASGFAIMSAISFIVGCALCVKVLTKKRKRK